jgi:hypothetical protein
VENIERTLQEFKQRNSFGMTSFPLEEAVKDHPEIKKMIDDYKAKFPEKSDPPVHDSRGTYRPKPVEPK